MARRDSIIESLSNSSTAQTIEELATGDSKQLNPQPQARGSEEYSRSTGLTGSVEANIESPEDAYADYWRLYETVPLVREPIRAFSSEVIQPGYWVEMPEGKDANPADEGNDSNRSPREQMEDWLSECAIVNGLKHKDFSMLVKKAIIQREVKGTVMIEKAKDAGSDKLAGFYFIPLNDDLQYHKYPNQNILIDPETNFSEIPGASAEDYVKTEEGKWAAYVQETGGGGGGGGSGGKKNDGVQAWTVNEVIKLVRDADTTDILGTSRLEAVEPRIQSLRDKLLANDQAIQSVAWKFWLFKFGSEEDPWPEGDVEEFMSNHSSNEFTPGQKQGVTGDVDIETVSGEVADITDVLQFDINWIMSAMPLPKYALGGFEQYINQFVSRSQETRIEYQIEEARREIEAEFNPAIQQKAMELGLVSEENKADVKLHIEQPPEERPVMPPPQQGNQGASGTDFTRPPASSEKEAQKNEYIRDESGLDWVSPSDASNIAYQQGEGGDGWVYPSAQKGDPDSSLSARVLTGDRTVAELEKSFSAGDVVNTGDEKGMVLEKHTEPFEWPETEEKVQASEEQPIYVVGLEETGVKLFVADELKEDEIEVEGVENPEKDIGDAELSVIYDKMEDPFDSTEIEELIDAPAVEGDAGWDDWPPSWKKSETPARLIFYDMWSSVGSSFSGCVRHFSGDVSNPNKFCASAKDTAYFGWTGWR